MSAGRTSSPPPVHDGGPLTPTPRIETEEVSGTVNPDGAGEGAITLDELRGPGGFPGDQFTTRQFVEWYAITTAGALSVLNRARLLRMVSRTRRGWKVRRTGIDLARLVVRYKPCSLVTP